MMGAKMDSKVERVARAFYEAEQDAGLWDSEPAVCREQFQEFARNAIKLLNDEIGILLPAFEKHPADERARDTGLTA
jgi:hypothetical protein